MTAANRYIQIAVGVMKKSRPDVRAASMCLVAIRANPYLVWAKMTMHPTPSEKAHYPLRRIGN